MKKTCFLLTATLFLILCSCSASDKVTIPPSDSEILRSRCFLFEATNEYCGKEINMTISFSETNGTITVSAEQACDTYITDGTEIYQIIEKVGDVKITETASGQSILNIVRALFECPDSSQPLTNLALYKFSSDGDKLIEITVDNVILKIQNITSSVNMETTVA